MRSGWQARITVETDRVTVGHPTTVEFRLEPAGTEVPDLPLLMLIVSWHTDARLEPAMAEYQPGGAPARFGFAAHEPGIHNIRFTAYDHTTGLVMQDLSTRITAK